LSGSSAASAADRPHIRVFLADAVEQVQHFVFGQLLYATAVHLVGQVGQLWDGFLLVGRR
jgi:hypothetical protein